MYSEIFGGEVIKAYFQNNDYNTITAEIKIDGEVHAYHVLASKKSAEMEELNKLGYTKDKLIELTSEEKRIQYNQYNQLVQQRANELFWTQGEKMREWEASIAKREQETIENFKQWEQGLKEWSKDLEERSRSVGDWDEKLKAWEANIKSHEQNLNVWQAGIEENEKNLNAWQAGIEEKELTLDQMTAKSINRSMENFHFDTIYNKNWSKDDIFKTKLWALELDEVRSSDKSLKSRIRKSRSIMEVFAIMTEVIKEKEED